MEELSFFDKLKVLFDNILDHPLFTLLFLVPVVLFFLQKKHGKKVYVIVYFLTILTVLFVFGDVIFDLFDNFMDGLFMVLYFPNFVTLFIVVILSSLFALMSLFSKKMYKVNRVINYTSFGIIQMLFTLILITVRINKINIYKDNALYTNSDVLTLMQLLIGMFAFQVIIILVINLINKFTYMLDKKSGKFSEPDSESVSYLKNTRKLFKNVSINNEKVGFINVADTLSTSKPKLKPFKFDIKKIESITLHEEVVSKPKLFNRVVLDDKAVSYLNEIIKPRKFKPIELDSNKIKSIKLNGKVFKDKLFNRIELEDKNFTYLNEIIKPRKFKPIELDSNKIKSIKLNGKVFKDKLFNRVELEDKDFTYLNEIIKPIRFKVIGLNSDKVKSVELINDSEGPKKKLYNTISLDTTRPIYSNEILANKSDGSGLIPTVKHGVTSNLDNKKVTTPLKKTVNIVEPIIYRIGNSTDKDVKNTRKLVDNLNIIDIQSTLDVISGYHLMKNVKLKGYDNVLTVDNLKISNFKLLFDILKVYKLYK